MQGTAVGPGHSSSAFLQFKRTSFNTLAIYHAPGWGCVVCSAVLWFLHSSNKREPSLLVSTATLTTDKYGQNTNLYSATVELLLLFAPYNTAPNLLNLTRPAASVSN